MIVNRDVDAYTKTRTNQKTLRKTKKHILIQKQAKQGLGVYIQPVKDAVRAPLSVTPLPLNLFTAQYNDFTCLQISSSSFSEAFSDTLTKIFGQVEISNLYTVQKNIPWSRLFIVFGSKISLHEECSFLAIKSDLIFSSIISTNIQKTLESPNAIAKRNRISQ